MKRAAKRAKIKAARTTQKENYLVNRYIRELEQSLKAAQIKEDVLNKELAEAKKELHIVRGALKQRKAGHQQIKDITVKLVTASKARIPSLPKISKSESSSVVVVTHRTREQWLEQNKNNFINQFIDRITIDFPTISKERIAALRTVLQATDAQTIDDILESLDDEFRHQYYESQSVAFYEGRGQEDFAEELFRAFNV